MMQQVNEEFNIFLEDMEACRTFCCYMDEAELEDDYSHNDILFMQEKFMEKATEWLREHRPGQYLVSNGWCVFVMTETEANKRNIWDTKHLLIG